MENYIIWGCIADDFEGAAEAASFFRKSGLKTLLYNGIPEAKIDDDVKAIVLNVGIKNIQADIAVETALEALEYLKNINVEKIYYKYSQDLYSSGNIGPVSKAMMDSLNEDKTILCPAFPANGYTVNRGIIYVNGMQLAESEKGNLFSRESEISEIMSGQSPYPCINVDLEEMQEDNEEIWNRLNEFERIMGKYYIVPDFISENDAGRIAEIFKNLNFLTGSSGVIEAIAKDYGEKSDCIGGFSGKALIISGSCSKSSLRQVDEFINNGGKAFKIDAIRLLYEKQTVGDLWNFMAENSDETVLIYSSDTEDNVKYNQRHGAKEISESLKNAMAELVETAVMNGYRRIVISGSESARAITDKLGYNAYNVGESVTRGVPVIIPLKNRDISIVIKSGDFGEPDFLERAVKF